MTVKLLIAEGARGAGKSAVTRKLRDRYSNATLINFTGFHMDGEEGRQKARQYYDAWLTTLEQLSHLQGDTIIICDRFFPSELVYSTYYKDYNFEEDYKELRERLSQLPMEIYYLHIELPPNDVLRERLERDKVPFGKAKESVEESFRQNMAYKSVLQDMVATPNILACHIPYVDGITVDQTADVIIGIVGQ